MTKHLSGPIMALVIATLLSSVSLSQNAPVISQINPSGEAQFEWDRMISALGGRDQLRKVDELLIMAHAWKKDQTVARSLAFVTLLVPSGKYWSWDHEPGFSVSARQYDFSSELGFEVVGGAVRTFKPSTNQRPEKRPMEIEDDGSHFNLTAKKLFFEEVLRFLPETVSLQPHIIGSGIDKIEGKTRPFVTVYAGLQWFQYFLNETTRRPIGVRQLWFDQHTGKFEKLYDVFLENYRLVDNIWLPTTMRYGKDTGFLLEYVVNPKSDPALFSKPPVPFIGPDSWRAHESAR